MSTITSPPAFGAAWPAKRQAARGTSLRARFLARQAADHGDTDALALLAGMPSIFNRLWPYGLDPDGTPTSPW
ncbi:hypothetical protein OG887_40005 [Streptomyces sp. NBC_00053]|uniref:hypothetical protein n=1 Tax=unclassified Streptomyces TaxID=2593676 RepID=UPI00224D3F23|nr:MULTISPECIES: hypothetical protein [unclassified Streptomyces]MCX5505458.1 hypothetical protein [Streptomyces sp. NBC_00052]MCX5546002.1 hypothetical protein [Streptomyces sp. NBC_00051]